MSKAYGLPGLRVGWLACRDRALLERLERRKHYTSICNAGPSEHLAAIALRNGERIRAPQPRRSSPPTCRLRRVLRPLGRALRVGAPAGRLRLLPALLGGDGEAASAARLLEAEGVLLLPGDIYYSEIAAAPADHFRVGIGRLGLEEGVAAFDRFLRAQN